MTADSTHRAAACGVLLWAAIAAPSARQSNGSPPTVKVFAAGSLAAPLNALAAAVNREHGIIVTLTFGPSGTLRERLEKGEAADIFASANMDHPQALSQAGLSGPTVQFTRNALCAFTRMDIDVTSATLLERMLETNIRLATSTPVADPAGDYAWSLFRKADRIRPGAYAILDAKALKLSGGAVVVPAPPPVPSGRNATAYYLESRTADIYLYYCSGRGAFSQDAPAGRVLQLPESLAVGADYGLTVMTGASPAAASVRAYILSVAGQRIFTDAGFQSIAPGGAPAVPG